MEQPRFFDAGPREFRLCAALAVAMVLIRCFPATWYEQLNFDSDQAIVGLMAKHLAEGRAFPLFFYGQHYMLGVQSWMAAPLFLIGGPSLLLLRLPLVIINCAVAVLLPALLARQVGLRPGMAFIAALPFIAPSPLVSTLLLQTLGASVEPFLYILLLWMLRRRPVWFGLVLAIGVLHREFTVFAVPALVLVMLAERSLFTRATLERLLTVVLVAVCVWIVIDQLKARVDVYGPATGRLENGPLSLEMQVMLNRVCLNPHELATHIRSMFLDCLPDLFGGRTFLLEYYGVNSHLSAGSTAVGWFVLTAGILMAVRAAFLLPRASIDKVSFPAYLFLVGIEAIVVYPMACEILPGYPGIVRYVFLGLLVPIGMSAVYLKYEPIPALKRLAVAAIVLWAAANFLGNLRLVNEYRIAPPESRSRQLADYLVDQHIKYGRADYWDAYVLDFLSGEKVVIGSEGKFRVREYETQINQNRSKAFRLVRGGCAGGTNVAGWCIVPPAAK